MTWGDFKRVVEAQYIEDDDELAWIDISGNEDIEARKLTDNTVTIASF